jgi:hypothetical protein
VFGLLGVETLPTNRGLDSAGRLGSPFKARD